MTGADAALLLLVGALSGFLNVMSAGGSMLTLPALMFMGLDSTTANGTNRVGIALQNVSAAWKYRRSGHHEWALAWRLSIPAIIGAIAGAYAATLVSDELFRWILIAVMIGASILMLMPKGAGIKTRRLERDEKLRWPIILALLAIGFYGGFIQVAVGILFIVLLYRVLHLDLIQVNILKVLIILIYTIPALAIFMGSGAVAWSYGLILAVGSMTGAWLGAKLTLGPSGARWITWLTLAIIGVIIVKLILDF
ncbi:hypothetical protein SAMN05216526_0287 [Ectothiorhodosinus mongolicus]|uniref:Probable membrane transporter protein n=1 Tax=Ectothiorhodosinus mongolicus TaxID=233100 RepID=A0A1R3VQK2_9GAMM|nr:sulfite exporter TauE/SafE family protein [Ectothiorhodosinus mongolicus]ULX56322.1 sulfite exporter TauE/SafE family protein [Ectothiorhodosinus mongolicus]SIT65833.1 hypothetical protein SAMN05216526_0287 [Ectothiorhodosinus mongolicus]